MYEQSWNKGFKAEPFKKALTCIQLSLLDGLAPFFRLNNIFEVLLGFIVKDKNLQVDYKYSLFLITITVVQLNYDLLQIEQMRCDNHYQEM